ncbi:hypothetical protein Dxin01_04122 [Deinococcus xinjiangensis]|uniref:Uncharacterized protein n=1 Tax=Deinococcus xinjiangensis TaxID=457454 RepID=A0ABP9VL04_9DEIO
MLMMPTVQTPAQQILSTMRMADKRLVRLVAAFATAFIVLSLAVAAAIPPCTGVGQAVNAGLDQMSLLMFAMLPVLYFSGKKNQSEAQRQ